MSAPPALTGLELAQELLAWKPSRGSELHMKVLCSWGTPLVTFLGDRNSHTFVLFQSFLWISSPQLLICKLPN